MTFTFRRIPWLLAALLGVAASAHAWPSTSPSAKSAARLKYHPPDNWLQHYLPDDRYKIAGGIWKVVSTQYDTYYHRPDSPYMLRQPASIVIGFASEQEAKEAGYRADGGFFVGSYGRVRPGARTKVKIGRGRHAAVVQGTRVLLSDGSSVVLPDGWTLMRGGLHNKTDKGVVGKVGLDFLVYGGDRKKSMMYIFADQPGNNAEIYNNPAYVRKQINDSVKSRQAFASTGGFITNQFDDIGTMGNPKNVIVSATRLSGMSGVYVKNFSPSGVSIIVAGKGSKLYGFAHRKEVAGLLSTRAITQSFQKA